MESGGAGGQMSGSGKTDIHAMESNLVSIRDVRMPTLSEAAPSVAVFRRWWKELAKYCQRRSEWRGAETLFKVIRGYPNEINGNEIPQFLMVCTNRDATATGANFGFSSQWNIWDRSKEMFSCVEIALNGKCYDVVASV